MPADPVGELEAALTREVGQAVERIGPNGARPDGIDVELERPKNASFGDYATTIAIELARRPEFRTTAQMRSPREVAEFLAGELEGARLVDRVEVAGPGFLNVWVPDKWLVAAVDRIVEPGPAFGANSAPAAERVQVEMVSANPTGPITVASARNGAYGDSVARLLEFAGHGVEREYYYNDAGAQMEKFRASVEARRRGDEPPEDGYRGAYVDELAARGGDSVSEMVHRIKESLERFRIYFDSWVRQSELEQRIGEFLPRLDTYEKDGAIWARASAYGDDADRVLIRSREQGATPTYRAADVVYLADKLDRGFDRALYVLGADHHGTRNWYAAVARMLGYDPDRVEVLLYQLVHLTKGGEQTKISKRRGDVVFLDDLLDEIGVDAARWYLVNRGPDQTMDIDIDLAAEKTQKNPVYYVQYAHARIAGILRNAPDRCSNSLLQTPALAAEERELVKRLLEFPSVLREATERRAPQQIPAYAIRVADDFHRFYHEHRVLESESEAFRLRLVRAVQTVIARCLDLVGVEAPDRM